MEHSIYEWEAFLLLILALLALDLGVFNRKAHAPSTKEALLLSLFWIAVALSFNIFVYYWFGQTKAMEFLTGYLIEKMLSVDNLFVFIMLFSYFGIEVKYQHRILFWGILGALITRGIFIGIGAYMIAKFSWIIYVFGALLFYSAYKMLRPHDADFDASKNPLINFINKIIPIDKTYKGEAFFVRHQGKLIATPLFVVLLVVESTDVMFAIDSIPAIFAVTRDPFIVFTSNVFAILGLRALYFALASIMGKFYYLKHGVAIILGFVGFKLCAHGFIHVPIAASLAIIFGVMLGSIIFSLFRKA